MGWIIYIDAFISSYGAGWVFAAYHNGFCVEIQNASLSKCSIFTAEAQAILYAMQYINRIEGLKKKEVVEVRCDSQAVIRALESTIIVDKMLRMVKEELRKGCEKRINVVLKWIPSHAGNLGNGWRISVQRERLILGL